MTATIHAHPASLQSPDTLFITVRSIELAIGGPFRLGERNTVIPLPASVRDRWANTRVPA